MNALGKGVQVWNLTAAYLDTAARIADLGFSWVAMKAADGPDAWNGSYIGAFVAELRRRNIKPWGWQFVYGKNRLGVSLAAMESGRAITSIKQYDLEGWVVDAEGRYDAKGMGGYANTYMTNLRASYPALPIGLQSYRWPSVHPDFPWTDFLRYMSFHAPQVYWIGAHNPGDQLRRSVKELQALKDLPVIPTGAAYADSNWPTGPSVDEINQFNATAKELNLPGLIWYSWDEDIKCIGTQADWRAAIKSHDWGSGSPAPVMSWSQYITAWARTLGYNGPNPEI